MVTQEKSLKLMTDFYNTFPYPGRALFHFPSVLAMSQSHCGFAQLLARGEKELAFQIVKKRLTARQSAALVESTAPADAEILLAGCGSDEPVLFLALHPFARIDCIDLSVRSLARARIKCLIYSLLRPVATCRWIWKRLLGHARKAGLSFRLGDFIRYCAIKKECYDHIQCFGVLHHQTNPDQALEMLVGSLRPGGTLRLMVYSKTGRLLERGIQRRLLSRMHNATIRPSKLYLSALRLKFWLLALRLTNPKKSERFNYISLRTARVADALLHPSDPGLDLGKLGEKITSLRMNVVYSRAKSQTVGEILGILEPETAWREILAEEKAGNLISNVELILVKGQPQ